MCQTVFKCLEFISGQIKGTFFEKFTFQREETDTKLNIKKLALCGVLADDCFFEE